MRRKVIVAAVLALALAVPASANAGGYGMQHVNAQDLYLRTYPQSYVVWILKYGEHFETQYLTDGNWAWGYAFGGYNGCAWTDSDYLVQHLDHPPAPDCGPPRELPTP